MRKLFLWLDKTWSRLLLASTVCGLGLFLILGYLVDGFEQKEHETHKLEMRRLSEVAVSTIRPIVLQQKEGIVSREEAISQISTVLRQMVYQDVTGYNYIFMGTYDGVLLVQPFRPSFEGTNQLELRDSNGFPLIAALIDTARTGGGFVNYLYPSPQNPEPQPKLSYVTGVPELGIFIGTGIYMDDLHARNREFSGSLLVVCLAVFLFTLAAQYALLYPLFRSYGALSEAFDRLSVNFDPSLRLPVTGYQEGSEAAKLLNGFNHLLKNIGDKTEALRWSEKKFRNLFEFANDAIMIGHGATIIDCNHQAELLFDLPKHELIGQTALMLSPEYQKDGGRSDEKMRHITQQMLQGKPVAFEWQHLRNGQTFEAEVSLGHFNIDGNTFVISIMRDITERKEVAAQLQQVHQELVASYEISEKNNRELQAQEEQIRQLAYHDPLTGLPNRRRFTDILDAELTKCKTESVSGTVLFFDLDNFKMINDSCGHVAGDRVLLEVSQNLLQVFGERYTVARFGGDEFIILLDNLQAEESVRQYAEAILELAQKQISFCGHRFQLSASIGAVRYPQDGDDVDELLKNADTALYAAKNGGKNKWLYFNQAMQENMVERLYLEQNLREALDNDEFVLHFQPVAHRNGKCIPGFEALLRWQHPEKGMIAPATFIPLAEESGLIIPIGNWVIKKACEFALRLLENGHQDIFVAANISIMQLTHPDFVASVEQLLKESGLPPKHLELEITESVLMDSMEENIAKLMELKKLGIRLALDDFGTGYSSLTYLQKLPIDVLKIDKSFIDDLAKDNRKTSSLVRFIIQLAHQLGLQVVAEGVETNEQRLRLQSYYCDMIQGYLISRPLPEEDALMLLANIVDCEL